MKVRITGDAYGKERVMNAMAIMGEFSPDETLWYSDKIGQVIEVGDKPNERGFYQSVAYEQGVTEGDFERAPYNSRLSPICQEDVETYRRAREKAEESDLFFKDFRARLDKVCGLDPQKP